MAALNTNLNEWLEEYYEIRDKRVKWELIKYNVRKFTMRYSRNKKKENMRVTELFQEQLNTLEQQLSQNPSDTIEKEYNFCKQKLNQIEDQYAQGAIVRSKVKYLEDGERCTKYFFDLEKYNYNKKHIRKLKCDDNTTITDEGMILI